MKKILVLTGVLVLGFSFASNTKADQQPEFNTIETMVAVETADLKGFTKYERSDYLEDKTIWNYRRQTWDLISSQLTNNAIESSLQQN